MIVKNKKKFIRSILVVIGIMISIIFFTAGISYSHKEVEYKQVSVSSGDTLWAIAKVEQEENIYYQGKDIRDIIQDIKKVNNLQTASLKVNQTLEIPTY